MFWDPKFCCFKNKAAKYTFTQFPKLRVKLGHNINLFYSTYIEPEQTSMSIPNTTEKLPPNPVFRLSKGISPITSSFVSLSQHGNKNTNKNPNVSL